MADGLQRTVHSRAAVANDKEIHVSTVIAPNGGAYTEIREYIVSLDQYSRGVTFPEETEILIEVQLGLEKARSGVMV